MMAGGSGAALRNRGVVYCLLQQSSWACKYTRPTEPSALTGRPELPVNHISVKLLKIQALP